MLVVSLTTLVLAVQNPCKQYTTCRTCLNISAGKSTGTRDYCGWCHFPITYTGGAIGPKCAYVKDQPTWTCINYDTYKCNAGYVCNQTSGQCMTAAEGEGYRLDQCQLFCKPQVEKYKCAFGSSNYTCQKCGATEEGCFPKALVCPRCIKPPPPPPQNQKYKCDRSQVNATQCKPCNANETGCSNYTQACASCQPPQQTYTCNTTTLKCEKAKSGVIGGACNATCGNFTPAQLQGQIYRGIEAHKGFTMGEYDFIFDNSNGAIIKTPDGKSIKAYVQSHGPSAMVLVMGNQTLSFTVQSVRQTDEVNVVTFATSGPGFNAPDTATSCMGAGNSRVFVMSSCNGWKGECDFKSVNTSTEVKSLLQKSGRKLLSVRDAPTDPCNQYTTCHTCISATKGGVNCGWCMGGTLDYNATGKSVFQCGGFQDGKPKAFICPGFRTSDCTGYKCSWNETQPKCYPADNGDFADNVTCGETCKPTQLAKCNPLTKKCEPCTGGADCRYTKDYCEASCAAPKSKCNLETHQCETCDEAKGDKNCTMTTGDCQAKCPNMKSYFKCNTTSRTCSMCKDSTDPLCMLGDKSTCDQGCAHSPTPTPPSQQTYKCDWSNNTCVVAKKGDPDAKAKEECEQVCKKAVFGKCNFTSHQCVECEQGPDCLQTMDWCKSAATAGHCKGVSPKDVAGVWRGIEISKGFLRGEWDITFSSDATSMKMQYYDTKVEKKWSATIAVTSVQSLEAGVRALELTFTDAPPNDSLLGVSTGTKTLSLFMVGDGYEGLFKVMSFAVAKPGSSLTSFSDAMGKGAEFSLVGCKYAKSCDFTAATPMFTSSFQSLFV